MGWLTALIPYLEYHERYLLSFSAIEFLKPSQIKKGKKKILVPPKMVSFLNWQPKKTTPFWVEL